MRAVSVEELFRAAQQKLAVELVGGKEGLANQIGKPRIQKSSLALTGYVDHIDATKIQFLGETEISYLLTLTPEERLRRLEAFGGSGVPCLIVTKGLEIPPELVRVCDARRIPLLRTPHFSSRTIKWVTAYLEEALAHRLTRPGVMVDVYGVGILILGRSGIGKSETALDLIDRGHRLVADDVVAIKKKSPDTLIGSSPDLTHHHMEIRGVGIINIQDLYGVSCIQKRKEIDLITELVEWSSTENFDRLGLDEQTFTLMDVKKPFLRMPVTPGRNMALIIEVAARNHLLKATGHFSARRFEKKLMEQISRNSDESGS